jgi:ferritin-like metal-binding protein YciE
MKIETLRDFYVEELKDLFSAENQFLKALQKFIQCATSPELRTAFEAHLETTSAHVTRLEQIFKTLDISPKGKHCKAMEGLIAEADEILKDEMPAAVKDAALIAAAQRVEHYEMAGYGCARTYARILGEDAAAELLDETLQEEGASDKRLTEIAEGSVNEEATVGVKVA